ncbi:hypothetical protein CL614_00485 [archaeon]|nr:hypothetical protein [archaeon]|tara:strand:+ start:396 stop:1034 length:639 start_codon:yes stop_codon:yes gene_type:complete
MASEESPSESSEKSKFFNEKNKEKIMAISLIVIAIIAATVIFILIQPGTPENVTKIIYQDQKYMFSHDIYDSDKITMENRDAILILLNSVIDIEVVFNDTGDSVKDFPYFTTSGYNIVYKIQQYSVYTQTRFLNITTTPLSESLLDKTTIMLKGPNSGAVETSITTLQSENGGNIILVQGLTHKELEMAGDKLVLAYLGVNLQNPNFTILQE